MRVAAYLRVSTDQQSHDSQRSELQDYCTRRGWTEVWWFVDTASGAKQDRSGLNSLMDLVRRRDLDAAVTFKFDRLARFLPRLAQLISEFQVLRLPSTGRVTESTTSNAVSPRLAADFPLQSSPFGATGR